MPIALAVSIITHRTIRCILIPPFFGNRAYVAPGMTYNWASYLRCSAMAPLQPLARRAAQHAEYGSYGPFLLYIVVAVLPLAVVAYSESAMRVAQMVSFLAMGMTDLRVSALPQPLHHAVIAAILRVVSDVGEDRGISTAAVQDLRAASILFFALATRCAATWSPSRGGGSALTAAFVAFASLVCVLARTTAPPAVVLTYLLCMAHPCIQWAHGCERGVAALACGGVFIVALGGAVRLLVLSTIPADWAWVHVPCAYVTHGGLVLQVLSFIALS